MNTAYNTKSTQELKNQVMQDIQKVKQDFEEIKNRMTPGQLIDEAIYYRRGGMNPSATFAHLKANPIGTSLLTLGTILLMEDSNHLTIEGHARQSYGQVAGRVSDVAGKVSSAVNVTKEKVLNAKDSIAAKLPHKDRSIPDSVLQDTGLQDSEYSVTDSVKDSVSGLGASAQEGFETAKSKLSDGIDSARSKIGVGVDSAKSNLNTAAGYLKDKSHHMVESARSLDPLTYLALGVGLGTITGAAIPVMDAEGAMVDRLFEDKFSKFSQELESAVNQSVNILKNEFIGGMTDFEFNLFS